MIDIQTVLTYLTLISIPVGVVYHIMTLNNTRKNQELTLKSQQLATETRQTQLFMQIYNRWTDPSFNENYFNLIDREWEDFDDWMARYGDQVKIRASNRAIDQYFEGIGVLVQRGLIDISLVDDMMSSLLISFWNKRKPLVYEARKRYNSPQIMEWTEYLYNKVIEVAKTQHPELTI